MPIYCLLYHTTRFFENLAREGNTFNIIYHKNQLYWIGKDKKKFPNLQGFSLKNLHNSKIVRIFAP